MASYNENYKNLILFIWNVSWVFQNGLVDSYYNEMDDEVKGKLAEEINNTVAFDLTGHESFKILYNAFTKWEAVHNEMDNPQEKLEASNALTGAIDDLFVSSKVQKTL